MVSAKSLAIIVAVILVALFVFRGSVTGFAVGSSEKVSVADIPIVYNGPLYYALDNKLFEKEGLQVEVVRFDSPRQIVDAVALNRVDFGGTGSATGISAIAESINYGNLKYYALSCAFNESDLHLLVRKDSNISSVRDLHGKKVGHLPAVQWRTIVRAILLKNEVDLEKTQLVELPVPLQLQSLESGQVDAVMALEPIATIGVSKGIAKIAVAGLPQKTIVDPFCAGSGIISTKFLKERPVAAAKVLKAMQQAISEYPKENRAYLFEKYLKMDAAVAKKLPFPSHECIFYSDLPAQKLAATQKFLDLFYEEGVMKKRVLVQDVLLKEQAE